MRSTPMGRTLMTAPGMIGRRLVHLVLDRFAPDRHFDDGVHVFGRPVADGDGVEVHGAILTDGR
jgi:hypothetical protein